MGGLMKMGLDDSIIERMRNNRGLVNGWSEVPEKSKAYVADGFTDIKQYYNSGFVEILTFYGDIFDTVTQTMATNRKIVVIDRMYISSDEPISSWLGESPIYHAAWRSVPDNLYGMGPLENLVGMQYRMDHLENLRADVFDLNALQRSREGHKN